jgi:hypothetical protein
VFNELFDLLAGGFLESVGSAEVDRIALDQFGVKLVRAAAESQSESTAST